MPLNSPHGLERFLNPVPVDGEGGPARERAGQAEEGQERVPPPRKPGGEPRGAQQNRRDEQRSPLDCRTPQARHVGRGAVVQVQRLLPELRDERLELQAEVDHQGRVRVVVVVSPHLLDGHVLLCHLHAPQHLGVVVEVGRLEDGQFRVDGRRHVHRVVVGVGVGVAREDDLVQLLAADTRPEGEEFGRVLEVVHREQRVHDSGVEFDAGPADCLAAEGLPAVDDGGLGGDAVDDDAVPVADLTVEGSPNPAGPEVGVRVRLPDGLLAHQWGEGGQVGGLHAGDPGQVFGQLGVQVGHGRTVGRECLGPVVGIALAESKGLQAGVVADGFGGVLKGQPTGYCFLGGGRDLSELLNGHAFLRDH